MSASNIFLSYAKKLWNSSVVGEICEAIGIKAGNSYYIQKYLPEKYSVHTGIFEGMKYLDTAIGSSLNSKLLGTYEAQIYPWIDTFKKTYTNIINLGCAEGYYTIGLARKFPKANVLAFDIDPNARKLCKQLAALNNVKNVQIDSQFTKATANKYVGGVIVCDIEGAEVGLLDPKTIPSLLKYDLIIECHDHVRPTTKVLIERFKNTHRFKTISHKEKRTKPTKLSKMPDEVFEFLSDENRRANAPTWINLMRKDG